MSGADIPPQVLLITDSLGFPRAEPEFVGYEETYVARLKRAHPHCDVVHLGIGGGTLADLYKFSSYYREAMQPALVFVQSGIVDCAPRALRLTEQQVISRLGAPGRWLQKLVARNSGALRRRRRIRYTSAPRFAQLKRDFDTAFRAPVHWIGILPARSEYEAKLPGIGAAIATYNAILSEARERYVAVEDFGAADTMSDFHHLSAVGHARLSERLSTIVRAHLPGR